MKELVEAFTIFSLYSDNKYPTHCEHDVMQVMVNPAIVSKENLKRLEEIGFSADEEEEHFYSYKFGSC